ncbi:hypothetical protein [Roseateles violae]|uniref:Uncharacterized protein n=1 Tax=Roseateles violae TaxID=3058042 RepID=A0ABT8DYR5_9BURK|nr:hypothetical protein [Pelomonas sp. PFR6]MDN3922717.1 hypothetical protein [Pelomonas sp. PFR6]
MPATLGIPVFMLLAACAGLPGSAPEGWRQLATAAEAKSKSAGGVTMRFEWQVPGKRLLMLASLDDEQVALYQFDQGLQPEAEKNRVRCHFEADTLSCAGLGEAAASPVAGAGTDLWTALASHAAQQIRRSDALVRGARQGQMAQSRAPVALDLLRQRHPFEWGGDYETVENAQAFLEALTARGTAFRSTWPQVPALGSTLNQWKNKGDLVTVKTTQRCASLASSGARTAYHHNHDFWASDTVLFESVYAWQQPIDWSAVEGVKFDGGDGVFMYGSYARAFNGQGLSYRSGWDPDILTANATRFDPAKYSVRDWNLHLVLPDTGGLRERALYAVTFLQIMCRKQG